MTQRTSPPQPPLFAAEPRTRRAVNFRSVSLGLIGVVFICGLTPFNDYVVANTPMVGSYFPVGLLMLFGLVVMLINAPLSRWAPRWMLSTGELSVALAMTLVSCSIPSIGLMKYLPATLVATWRHAGGNSELRSLLTELNLPDWIYPAMEAEDVLGRANDPVISNFWGRIPLENPTFLERIKAVPWDAWLTPALTWGVLLAAIFGAVICMMVIVRRQWVENERLPFPLATIYLSLIETPPRGRAFNDLFRSRSFWIAFGVIFAIHAFNAFHKYNALWPEIPIDYDLEPILTERPWNLMPFGLRRAQIYFSIIGITFFLQTQVAFSVWIFYVLFGAATVAYAMNELTFSDGIQRDQLVGGVIPFFIAILWVGRHHWMVVLRQMFSSPRPHDARGRYLPYFLAGWGFFACLAIAAIWLCVAGTTLIGAVVILSVMFMIFFVTARIVAETGLPFVQLPMELSSPWIYVGNTWSSVRTSMKSHLFSSYLTSMLASDTREALAPNVANSLRVSDSAAYEGETNWRRVISFTLCLVLALAIGYVVAGASMLATEYSHAVTMDNTQALVNAGGIDWNFRVNVFPRVQAFRPPNNGPNEPHDPWVHLGIGAAIATTLSVLRLRFSWWPLHPVGFLLCSSYPLHKIWFSVFIGWILKVLVVRFGGAAMFRIAKPIFIGMIMGEAAAAAFWLVVTLIRAVIGLSYERIVLFSI